MHSACSAAVCVPQVAVCPGIWSHLSSIWSKSDAPVCYHSSLAIATKVYEKPSALRATCVCNRAELLQQQQLLHAPCKAPFQRAHSTAAADNKAHCCCCRQPSALLLQTQVHSDSSAMHCGCRPFAAACCCCGGAASTPLQAPLPLLLLPLLCSQCFRCTAAGAQLLLLPHCC